MEKNIIYYNYNDKLSLSKKKWKNMWEKIMWR